MSQADQFQENYGTKPSTTASPLNVDSKFIDVLDYARKKNGSQI